MQDTAAAKAPDRKPFLRPLVALVGANVPTLAEASLAIGSALLLILSFPNFDLWPLAWMALAPLILAVIQAGKPARAFILGWLWGAVFFYGSCWWLTYSMIHYGHLQPLVAYLLLILPVALGALFPALSCFALALLTTRFGNAAIFAAPFIWVSLEWGRYVITGEAWNAIGYSQAFHPAMIQTARWGGVYAVGFLIVTANAAIAFALIRPRLVAPAVSVVILVLISLTIAATQIAASIETDSNGEPPNLVVAVQPNVPMDGSGDAIAMRQLLDRHTELSLHGLHEGRNTRTASILVVWPESPMNFTYTTDPQLQKTVADFAIANRTAVLLNSLEPAQDGGSYNSAIMVNEEGRKVAQYDKIRLMPFGEYVPLPHWLPGASSVRAVVGEFKPGSSYTLMPLGALRAGVFICFEAAHPSIARTFTKEGSEVLINISNDGYLGPTPVMRQHLANAILRAVENDRTVLRVTNTGITALIGARGRVRDATPGFEPAVRTWTVRKEREGTTFYTRHGDVFVYACAVITLGFLGASFFKRPNRIRTSTIRRG
jgi:apolipoprotein N-acyltransferase